jgi:DNA-binding NarL/FixJ family response regulator
LADEVRSLAEPEDLLTCVGLKELSRELVRPDHGIQIGLLAMKNGAEITELFGLKSVLGDIRLVILLEKDDQETIALAHQLKPRYLGPSNQSLDEAKIVLKHMLDRLSHPTEGK